MKDLLLFRDDCGREWLLGIVLWLFILFFSGLLFFGVDYCFGQHFTELGTVNSKLYNPPYISYETTITNNSTINIPISHPPEFELKLKTKDGFHDFSVPESYWNDHIVGDTLSCVLAKGLITGNIYSSFIKY